MENRSEMDDLLMAARGGSIDALGKALESCRVYLTLVASRELDPVLRAKGGASDIVQETFIEAQRAFPRFASATQEEFLAWLRRLLLNNVSDFRRRYRGTNSRATDREIRMDAGNLSADWRAQLVAPTHSPSVEIAKQETEKALEIALGALPEDYRQIVTARCLENRSFEEIAIIMNRTPNAVRKLFVRAIERLQRDMEIAP
jgi:RNA polymerase sigma-70 factor (ECF subfamily)